jgi:hypothetical protein
MGMTAHPVQFHVEAPAQMERIHIVIRLAILLALGTVAWSSVYWFVYLLIPAAAALVISQKSYQRYFAEDAPPIGRVLHWLAAAYAYLWLLTDRFPTGADQGPVEFRLEVQSAPTVSSALLRLIYTLPALFVLVIISIAASFLWIIGAITIVLSGKLPSAFANFFALKLRYQFRLLAYHLSLVDQYPSFAEAPLTQAPHSATA